MSITPTKKYFLGACLFLGLSIACLVYVGYLIQKNGTQLKDDMSAIALKEKLKKERVSIEKAFSENETDRLQLESYVLRGQEGVVELLGLLDSIATEQGVQLETKRLDYQQPREGSVLATMQIEMEISGIEPAATRMLEIVETVPYHRTLKSLSSTRTVDPVQGKVVKHSIVYTVSSRPQP